MTSSPLTRFPGLTVVLPPAYYASIPYYALMAACGKAVVDCAMPYDKRLKSVHRCEIADTHGLKQLTVPVTKPHGIARATWNDVGVSTHGAWWHVHRVTLESAFGRTPFFEYYIDRFLPFLQPGTVERFPLITQLDEAIDREVRDILLIDSEITYRTDAQCESSQLSATGPAVLSTGEAAAVIASAVTKPYYQVRASKHGFVAGLSVLDLIFNLGPESPLYLRDLIAKMPVPACL